MKTCNRCMKHQRNEQFLKDARMKGGLRNECKACRQRLLSERKAAVSAPESRQRDMVGHTSMETLAAKLEALEATLARIEKAL